MIDFTQLETTENVQDIVDQFTIDDKKGVTLQIMHTDMPFLFEFGEEKIVNLTNELSEKDLTNFLKSYDDEDLKHHINQYAKAQKENEHSQDKPVTLYQQKMLKSANDKVVKKQHEKEVEKENSMRSGSDIEI